MLNTKLGFFYVHRSAHENYFESKSYTKFTAVFILLSLMLSGSTMIGLATLRDTGSRSYI